tara:strand:- start:12810 stop:13196 length:387 start_codon:yes stop_codon:yes gene_type:complete
MEKQTKSNTLKKEAMLDALEKTLGVVTAACRKVGIVRSTFYEWYKKDKKFKASVDELNNVALDFAESQLHLRMQSGSDSAIIFYLKTKGKDRGYVERQEVTGKDGDPVQIVGFNYIKPNENNANDKTD